MAPAATSRRDGLPRAPRRGLRRLRRGRASPRWCARRSTWARAPSSCCAATPRSPSAASASTTARPARSTPAPAGRSSRRRRARRPGRPAPAWPSRRSSTSLETDWLVLDCELLPWSAKALGLIRDQYASVGAAAAPRPARGCRRSSTGRRRAASTSATCRPHDRPLGARATRSATPTRRTAGPTDGLDGSRWRRSRCWPRRAACSPLTEPHPWHLEQLAASLDDPVITPTRHRLVDLASEAERGEPRPTGGSS